MTPTLDGTDFERGNTKLRETFTRPRKLCCLMCDTGHGVSFVADCAMRAFCVRNLRMVLALSGSKETRMHCAFCYREIDRLNAWRGARGIIYCSEFCAEEYGLEPERAPSLPAPGTAGSRMRTETPRALAPADRDTTADTVRSIPPG